MTVTLVLFGAIRERLGKDTVDLILPGKSTVRDALQRLHREHPGASAYFGPEGLPLLNVALGEQLAPLDLELKGGETLDIIAPIAGGAP
jgi:molybdopterin converting factor small subunit